MIGPLGYAFVGLLVAGIVHLTSILAMPWLAPRDGYHRLLPLMQEGQVRILDMQTAVPFSDPSLVVGGCRYNLEKGPVRIRIATGSTPFAMLLLRSGAGVFHSVTDKAATQGILEVVVATRQQMDQIIDLDVDDDPVQEIRVVSLDEVGIALVRGFVPLPSQRADVERLVKGTTCESERLDEAD